MSEGSRIARNDLRLKLMRKRLSKPIQNVAEEREKMDPHNRLSNAIQPPMSSYMLPHGPDPNRSNPSRRILPKGIANDLHQVDSMGTFYSTHNMGGPRVRSPERIFKSSSGLLPPRSYNEMRPKTWRRETEVSRGGWSLSSEVPERSRPRGSTPVTMKTASYAGNLVTRVSPTTGIMQMLPHVVLLFVGLVYVAILFEAMLDQPTQASSYMSHNAFCFSLLYRERNLSLLVASSSHLIWGNMLLVFRQKK